MTQVTLVRCPGCDGRVRRQLTTIETAVRPHELVVTEHALERCDACGEIFFAPGEMEMVDRAASDVVRAREGLLAPEEIRGLRVEMGLSQAAFERLLRVGAKTVVRWERGTGFPNRATDTLLRVLRAVPSARDFLKQLAPTPSDGTALTSR